MLLGAALKFLKLKISLSHATFYVKYIFVDAVRLALLQETFVQAASAPAFAARAQEEKNTSMYGSYSGVSFASSFDPDNIAVDRQPIYSG